MKKSQKFVITALIGFLISLVWTIFIKPTALIVSVGITAVLLLVLSFIIAYKELIKNVVLICLQFFIIGVSSLIIWANNQLKSFVVYDISSVFPLIILITSIFVVFLLFFATPNTVGIKGEIFALDEKLWHKVNDFWAMCILSTAQPIFLLIFYLDGNNKKLYSIILLVLSTSVLIIKTWIVVSKHQKKLDFDEINTLKEEIKKEQNYHF